MIDRTIYKRQSTERISRAGCSQERTAKADCGLTSEGAAGTAVKQAGPVEYGIEKIEKRVGGLSKMTWKDIILAVIASAGGIGGIIVLVVKFSANMIADRLEKKYTLKIDKELEKYKSSLESKIYISKTKFDTEFGIYRELSKAFFDMVKNITTMIPDGFATYPADKEQRKEYEHNLYVEAQKSTVLAQDTLNANAPFIPESLFKQYDEILRLCKRQITAFQKRWNVLYFAAQDEKESFSTEDYHCSKLIREQFEKLNSAIREYISKLDVTE